MRRRSIARANTRRTSASCSSEQDILGLPFAEEYGGTGTGTLMLQIAVEEIARECASSALILMIQELGSLPITLFGTDEQRQKWLPRLATGEISPGVRPLGARGRLGPCRDAHDARSRTATSGS